MSVEHQGLFFKRWIAEYHISFKPAMESKIFSRIFGEFSPSRGDLVFSKTGDLLGIMVNNSYCVMIDRLLTSEEVRFGEQIGDQETSNVLNAMKSRLNSLPPQLQ